MIQPLFHRWERQLASVSSALRIVRDFDWGLDWIDSLDDKPSGLSFDDERAIVSSWIDEVMNDTDAFFTPPPTNE